MLAEMMRRAGRDPATLSVRSLVAQSMRRQGVPWSKDVDRVVHLPRRIWHKDPTLEEFTDELTESLKTPLGEMRLWTTQAYVLHDLYLFGGCLAPVRVAGGKTLISALAAEMLDASRPMLVVPSAHISSGKTSRELHEYRKHFRFPLDKIVLESYQHLGRISGARALDAYSPDLLILDECHYVKNRSAAVTKRVRKYINQARKEGRPLAVLAMSGTITTRSLHDYYRILKWCVPHLLCLPAHENELKDWADAIDEKVPLSRRIRPGALEALFTDEERALSDPLKAVRRAYGRRLTETPGVVASIEAPSGVSLVVTAVEPKYRRTSAVHETPCYRCEQTGKFLGSLCLFCKGKGKRAYTVDIAGAFRRLREAGETPDGQPIPDRVGAWRHAREIACGFFYRWHPPPPAEWMLTRQAWYKFVRATLSRARRIESMLQVKQENEDNPLLKKWLEVKPLYDPKKHQQAVWIDDGCIDLAADWLANGAGICWVEHRAFGRRLSDRTGIPYCGAGGRDAQGIAADEHKGPIICSIRTIGEGFNMQHYSRNLVVSCDPNGKRWEQVMGRTDRPGQKEDEITFEVVFACREQWEGFLQARNDGTYAQDTLKQAQKLAYADIAIDTHEMERKWDDSAK